MKARKGAAMVEFAIVLPILTLVMFGIIEAGNAWHREQVLATAAREGARKAAVYDPATTQADVESAITRYLVGGGINPADVGIATDWIGVPSGNPVTVTLTYTLNFPVLSRLTRVLPAARAVTVTATMRKE